MQRTSTEQAEEAVGSQESPANGLWLQSVQREMAVMQRQLRLQLQRRIGEWTGVDGLDEKAAATLAKTVQRLLDGHGFRACCPQCGHPAVVRHSKRGQRNVFVFDHKINGKRTFHGGRSQWPAFQLMLKEARSAGDK